MRDPANWPEPMRKEWGDDEGITSHKAHKARVFDAFRKIRAEIDAFKPDFILIQFGHNDQKTNIPSLGTDPETTFRQNLTRFVNEARAIGAKPVLITSVSRRRWGDDGKTHSDLFPYVNPVKSLAPQLNVPLIDLHALSIELYDRLGEKEVDKLEASYVDLAANPGATTKPVDHTHFNRRGSQVIGSIVAAELVKVVPELKSNLK